MKLEINEFSDRIHRQRQYDVITDVYPGTMTLKSIPWRGKLRHWLEGVSRPVDNDPSRHLTREAFDVQKHYRTPNGGTMSATGDPAVFGIEADESKRITDPAEIDAIYHARIRDERTLKVNREVCEIHWYPSVRDHEGHVEKGKTASGLYLNYDFCWQPEPVTETETTVTVRFKPTLLAQLRHRFRLKPWTFTLHAAPATA